MSKLQDTFKVQKAAHQGHPYPTYKQRRDTLVRLNTLLTKNKDAIIEAINQDFGCRSRTETIMAETLGCNQTLHYHIKNLKRWMRPTKYKTGISSFPAKNYSLPQPLGVVGIIAPWNYPLHLSIAPLIAALSAGNRAMIWLSEETPNYAILMDRLIQEYFDPNEVSIFTGKVKQAEAFSKLPFGHLLFTGSTHVGRLVATAAAQNLTPVTLELGGKSPVIIAPDYPIEEAAERISWGKTFNAGQTCIAPDYVLLPKGNTDKFTQSVMARFKTGFSGVDDPDYTAIISKRFYDRLKNLVRDAKAKGATIIQPDGVKETDQNGTYKFPLTVVVNPPIDCALMKEEIFGPILIVLEYDTINEAIKLVNDGDNPLSLYCFSNDKKIREHVLKSTLTGNAAINDVLLQYAQEDLAFGGVGASGTGQIHGKAGFDTFSHHKSILQQRGIGRFTGLKLLYPPYTTLSKKILSFFGG